MPFKKLAVLALGVVLLFSGLVQAKMVWWKADSKVGLDPLLGVSAGDSLHVWAVGIPGRVIRSTDGGITWSLLPSPPFGLHQVDFIDSLRGWGIAGSSEGAILHTETGGQSWMVQNDTAGMTLIDIEFIDSLHGVAVGGRVGGGYALFTKDGGQTWRKSFYPIAAISTYIFTVNAVDTNHVWIGGFVSGPDTAVSLFSSDWGNSWQPMALHEGPLWTVITIDFVDTLNGYLLAQYGNGAEHHLYRSGDGGLTWTRILELSAFSNWNLEDMDATDSSHVWMAGYLFQGDFIAAFLSTSDGGVSWDTTLTETFGVFGEIETFSNNRGWAVGGEGLLYVYSRLILGDLNMDREVTAADVVLELNKVFLGQTFSAPQEAADVNCDGLFTAADVVLHLRRAFLGEPFPCTP